MQHPDEGTIHTWLDGALPGEQARELERHLSGCAACQAQVAEARGITAGASRILAALDGVPAGVVPHASSGQARLGRAWWKRPVVGIAATMAIVATGTVMAVTHTWDAARPSADETLTAVLVGAPSAASEAVESAAASAPGEMPARAVSRAGQPAQGNAASRLLERDREPIAGLADRQAASERGQVEPAPAPLQPAPGRVAEKSESAVAQRAAEARTAEQDAAAKARAAPPAGQAAAIESTRMRREASGARTRTAPSAPTAAAEQARPPALGAVTQRRSYADASGCYAVAIRGATDDGAPAVPPRVRLTAPGAVGVDADVATPVMLDVPFTGDSASVGWWAGAGDSVVVRLAGAGGAARIAFPVDLAESRVGVAAGVDTAGRSWSAAVEVRRIPCPDGGRR